MSKHPLSRPLVPFILGIAFSSIAAVLLPVPSAMAEMPAAASAILREAHGDPGRLPAITAETLVSQRGRNAAAIVEAVVASAPLSQASAIAAAIGSEFYLNPQLADQAPEIAAAITRALLGKLRSGASYAQVRNEIAESVASLTVLLPGTLQANHARIVNIGRAVAGEIGSRYPGIASSVVASTAAALKATAGSSDIASILNDFQGAFRNEQNAAQNTAQNTAGQQNPQNPDQPEPVGAEDNNLQFLPMSFFSGAAVRNSTTLVQSVGSVTTPETSVQNR